MKNKTILFIGLICFILFFILGCVTNEPIALNKPNPVYPGNYPPSFEELRKLNPVLAEELGKLPDIQDGISQKEFISLKNIVLLYKQNSKVFQQSFEEMMKVGISEIRKYNSPLQSLFWIIEKGELSMAKKIISHFDLEALLLGYPARAWLIDSKEWNKFEVVADRLNSPELLFIWMKKIGKIAYGWPGYPDMVRWKVRSPEEVFESETGDCVSQSIFAKSILNRNGYKGALLFVDRRGSYDHGVYYWKKGEKYFYLDHAFKGFEGIYGPFNKINEISSQIYEQLAIKDGKRSQKIVSSFDNVRPGDNWKTFLQKTTLGKTTDWN